MLAALEVFQRSQDKKIVMIGVRKGPQEGRYGTKRRNKEKSTAQEENHNITSIVQLRSRLNMHRPLLE